MREFIYMTPCARSGIREFTITSGIPALRAGPASHNSHILSLCNLQWYMWPRPPYNHRGGVKGNKWCDFGQDRCRFRFDPHMTFDLGWPWPWTPITIGGSRATSGASFVKIGAGVCEIWWWPWNDLWWPWLNSPANFKIFTPKWPLTLDDLDSDPPITVRGVKGYKWCKFGQDRCRVLEWLRNIHTPPHPVNYIVR